MPARRETRAARSSRPPAPGRRGRARRQQARRPPARATAPERRSAPPSHTPRASVVRCARRGRRTRTRALSAARTRTGRRSARSRRSRVRPGSTKRWECRAGGRARSSRRRRESFRRSADRRCAPPAAEAAADQARASSSISLGRKAASTVFASTKRHRPRSGSPIAFASHAHLDRRDACERRRAQDGIALHRLDLAAVRAADPGGGPDRLDACVGQSAARGVQQPRVGGRRAARSSADHRRRSRPPRCRARAQGHRTPARRRSRR